MRNLLDELNEVRCGVCKERLYKFIGKVVHGEVVRAKDFIPVNDQIPQPTDGELIRCPLCGAQHSSFTDSWFKK